LAVEFTQEAALQASSTAGFEPFASLMNCRYRANSCGFAGIGESLYPILPSSEDSQVLPYSIVGTAVENCLW